MASSRSHSSRTNVSLRATIFRISRFDRRKILRRERRIAGEVVIEAVLDRRSDRHLRAGVERLHRFGQNVGGIVPDHLPRAASSLAA